MRDPLARTDAGVGVSARKDGLLPLTQNSLLLPRLAFHEYERGAQS
ncbi:MAG: hypothetical protein R3C16_01440 [Hyphomonadaceae bacterium]